MCFFIILYQRIHGRRGIEADSLSYPYNSDPRGYNGLVSLVDQLPMTSEWKNISLKSAERQLLTYNSLTVLQSRNLLVFSYSGKAARLLTYQEVATACNLRRSGLLEGYLSNDCLFMMEDTKYQNDSIISYGYWLESLSNQSSRIFAEVISNGMNIDDFYVYTTNRYGVRPTIDVFIGDISY